MDSYPRDLQHLSFPNESREYRSARNALLAREIELRREIERVAAERRALPVDGNTIRHRWASELLYVPAEPGQENRHNDLLDPMWNLFDVTPEGRGDFQPKLEYR